VTRREPPTDERLRRAQRRFAETGAVEDEVRLRVYELRSGLLERAWLRAGALCRDEAARLTLERVDPGAAQAIDQQLGRLERALSYDVFREPEDPGLGGSPAAAVREWLRALGSCGDVVALRAALGLSRWALQRLDDPSLFEEAEAALRVVARWLLDPSDPARRREIQGVLRGALGPQLDGPPPTIEEHQFMWPRLRGRYHALRLLRLTARGADAPAPLLAGDHVADLLELAGPGSVELREAVEEACSQIVPLVRDLGDPLLQLSRDPGELLRDRLEAGTLDSAQLNALAAVGHLPAQRLLGQDPGQPPAPAAARLALGSLQTAWGVLLTAEVLWQVHHLYTGFYSRRAGCDVQGLAALGQDEAEQRIEAFWAAVDTRPLEAVRTAVSWAAGGAEVDRDELRGWRDAARRSAARVRERAARSPLDSDWDAAASDWALGAAALLDACLLASPGAWLSDEPRALVRLQEAMSRSLFVSPEDRLPVDFDPAGPVGRRSWPGVDLHETLRRVEAFLLAEHRSPELAVDLERYALG